MNTVKLAASKTKEFKEFPDDIGRQLLALSPQIAGIYKSFQDKSKAIDLDIDFEHIYNLYQFLRGMPIVPRSLNKIRAVLQIDAPLIQRIYTREINTKIEIRGGKWLEMQFKKYRERYASFVQEIACAYEVIYTRYDILVLFSMLSYFDSLHFKHTVNKNTIDSYTYNDPYEYVCGENNENVFETDSDNRFYLYHSCQNCNGFIFDEINAGGEDIYGGTRPWIYRAKI